MDLFRSLHVLIFLNTNACSNAVQQRSSFKSRFQCVPPFSSVYFKESQKRTPDRIGDKSAAPLDVPHHCPSLPRLIGSRTCPSLFRKLPARPGTQRILVMRFATFEDSRAWTSHLISGNVFRNPFSTDLIQLANPCSCGLLGLLVVIWYHDNTQIHFFCSNHDFATFWNGAFSRSNGAFTRSNGAFCRSPKL